MSSPTTMSSLVFLLDVDNTLLDNDRFAADLSDHLDSAFGRVERDRYWALYYELRDSLGYADYLGALQRFRSGLEDNAVLWLTGSYVLDYPFADLVYPNALNVVALLRTMGHPVILSDGDAVFQPRKIQRAGLWEALNGDVLIYVHKQHSIAAMQARYPASHYVMIDDKPLLLREMKQVMGERLTTVFVRQGHYAEANDPASRPAPDLEIAHIGDLLHMQQADFLLTEST